MNKELTRVKELPPVGVLVFVQRRSNLGFKAIRNSAQRIKVLKISLAP
jgi:hypothetical protein